MQHDYATDGLRETALAATTTASAEDVFEELNRCMEALGRHLVLVSRTHGASIAAEAQLLLDDLRHAASGAQRTTAIQRGGLLRQLDGVRAELADYTHDEEQTMEAVEALLLEVEQRNRRSHAKTSRAVAKARKLVDQYHLDRS